MRALKLQDLSSWEKSKSLPRRCGPCPLCDSESPPEVPPDGGPMPGAEHYSQKRGANDKQPGRRPWGGTHRAAGAVKCSTLLGPPATGSAEAGSVEAGDAEEMRKRGRLWSAASPVAPGFLSRRRQSPSPTTRRPRMPRRPEDGRAAASARPSQPIRTRTEARRRWS